jgi:hypothetical protein
MAVPAGLLRAPTQAMGDYDLPPLTPEEEEGFLSSIGSRTLSGLGAVGNFLDLPGSMLRDTLTGNNPFDQLLSPLTGDNRMSGRGMLEQWGTLGPNQEGLDWGDAFGFGAEVLFDPLSYVGLGGLGKAGQLAQRTGHMDDLLRRAAPGVGKRVGRMRTTMDDLLAHADDTQRASFEDAAVGMGFDDLASFQKHHGNDPLGGMVGVGLPFMDPMAAVGTGDMAQKIGGAFDKVGDTLRYGKIPGTEYSPGIHMGQLFDYESKGLGTKYGQEVLGPSATKNDRGASAFASEVMAEPIEQYESYLDNLTRDLPDINPEKWTPEAGETKLTKRIKVHDALRKGLEDIEFDKRGMPEEFKELTPIVAKLRQELSAMPERELAEGVKSSLWDSDYQDYATRYAYQFPNSKSGVGFDASFLKTSHRSQKGRSEILDMFGGTPLINDLTTNPLFSGIAHHIKPSEMDAKFWKKKVDQLQEVLHQKGLMNWTYDKNTKLVKWLANLDPRYVQQNIPLFPHNPLHDVMRRLEYGERSIRNAKLIRNQLMEFAVDAGSETPKAVRLDQAARSFSGLDPNQNSKLLAEQAGLDTSYWDEAAMTADDRELLTDMAEDMDLGQELGELDSWVDKPQNPLKGKYIPKERYDELHKLEEAYKTPEAVETLFTKIIDPINRLWQASVTRAFPSFHIRNLVAGQAQNWVAGGWSLRGMRDSHHIMQGNYDKTGSLKTLPVFKGKGYTDAEAGKAIADMAFQHKLVGKGQGLAMEGLSGTTLDVDLAGQIPGVRPYEGFGKTMGKYVYNKGSGLQGFNPLSDKFAPYEWGGDVGSYMEGLNRITPFIEFLRKGMSPEAAAKKVREIQFDYQALTAAEKNIFRRAIPFWTFSKNQALHTFDELTQRPGGKLAQFGVRAPNKGREEGEPLPEYLSQTAAIPLGQLGSGADRYLTGFGMSHEDPLSFLSVRDGMPDFTDTLSEVISRTSPLLKLPIEAATGESFFQRGPMGGRELQDMDPTMGRLLTNLGMREEMPGGRAEPLGSTNVENLIANSPFSRFTTTARTLTDPRKREGDYPGLALGGQLLSGVRVSDLSPAAREAILREEASAMMKERGAKTWEQVVFNKEQVAEAAEKDPELAREMIKFNRLQRYLASQAKKRKKAKQATASAK